MDCSVAGRFFDDELRQGPTNVELNLFRRNMPPMRARARHGSAGQAYLSLSDGKHHVASGDRVLLAPVTSYTEEAVMVKVRRGRKMVDPIPEAMKFEQHAKTDAEGQFCFTGLPAGEYYVVADIALPTSTKEHRESQLAHAKASVKADENVYILVTR